MRERASSGSSGDVLGGIGHPRAPALAPSLSSRLARRLTEVHKSLLKGLGSRSALTGQ